MQGKRDAQSLIAKADPKGNWTGFWRLLNEYNEFASPCPTCVPPLPGSTDDFILGTIPDLVGVIPTNPTAFGMWKPLLVPHWLWGNDPPPAMFGTSAALDGTGGPAGTVGHEADSYVKYVMDDGMGSTYVPASGGVQVLAMGLFGSDGNYVNYYGAAANSGAACFRKNDYDDLFMMTQQPSFMDDFMLLLGTTPPTRDVASITYYHHVNGGCVLSIPTTACTWALGAPGDMVVKNMVQRAVRCFLQVNPPAGCDCGSPLR